MQFQFTGKSPSRNLGSQFEKMCMNDLTDTQLLSKKNDKQHLFTSESTVTWDAVKTMNREVNGKAVARSCFVIMAVLLLISEAVLVTANSIVGYLLITLAVLIPLLLWLRVRYGGRSAYEKKYLQRTDPAFYILSRLLRRTQRKIRSPDPV